MERTRRPTRPGTQSTSERADTSDLFRDVSTSDEMVAGGEDVYDPATAEEIWRIAARLQAEAARRLDDRSREIAQSEGTASRAAGFSLGEVKMIGDEAGIDVRYIELALRQHAARKYASKNVSAGMSDLAGRFLGTREESLAVTRVIKAERSKVLESMKQLFPSEPFNLQLLEVVGNESNLADSTLIFKVPQTEHVVSAGGVNMFAYRMSIADLNRMTVTLHSIDDRRTEVSVQLDLKFGKWRNFKFGVWIAGTFAVIFGFLAFTIVAKKSSMGIPGIAGVSALVTAAVGYGSYWAYRLAYRSGLRKGEKEIEDLLSQVDVHARTGGGFGTHGREL